jgi:hypothetical protein
MEWRPLQGRCAAAVGAAWLTRRPNEGWSRRAGIGVEVDTARKRAGSVVAEASEAGLAPWSGRIGAIHGSPDVRRDPSRLNRVGHLGTTAP